MNIINWLSGDSLPVAWPVQNDNKIYPNMHVLVNQLIKNGRKELSLSAFFAKIWTYTTPVSVKVANIAVSCGVIKKLITSKQSEQLASINYLCSPEMKAFLDETVRGLIETCFYSYLPEEARKVDKEVLQAEINLILQHKNFIKKMVYVNYDKNEELVQIKANNQTLSIPREFIGAYSKTAVDVAFISKVLSVDAQKLGEVLKKAERSIEIELEYQNNRSWFAPNYDLEEVVIGDVAESLKQIGLNDEEIRQFVQNTDLVRVLLGKETLNQAVTETDVRYVAIDGNVKKLNSKLVDALNKLGPEAELFVSNVELFNEAAIPYYTALLLNLDQHAQKQFPALKDPIERMVHLLTDKVGDPFRRVLNGEKEAVEVLTKSVIELLYKDITLDEAYRTVVSLFGEVNLDGAHFTNMLRSTVENQVRTLCTTLSKSPLKKPIGSLETLEIMRAVIELVNKALPKGVADLSPAKKALLNKYFSTKDEKHQAQFKAICTERAQADLHAKLRPVSEKLCTTLGFTEDTKPLIKRGMQSYAEGIITALYELAEERNKGITNVPERIATTVGEEIGPHVAALFSGEKLDESKFEAFYRALTGLITHKTNFIDKTLMEQVALVCGKSPLQERMNTLRTDHPKVVNMLKNYPILASKEMVVALLNIIAEELLNTKATTSPAALANIIERGSVSAMHLFVSDMWNRAHKKIDSALHCDLLRSVKHVIDVVLHFLVIDVIGFLLMPLFWIQRRVYKYAVAKAVARHMEQPADIHTWVDALRTVLQAMQAPEVRAEAGG